jgi:hypothetical protein
MKYEVRSSKLRSYEVVRSVSYCSVLPFCSIFTIEIYIPYFLQLVLDPIPSFPNLSSFMMKYPPLPLPYTLPLRNDIIPKHIIINFIIFFFHIVHIYYYCLI